MMATLARFRPDNFTLLIVAMVLLATVAPAEGTAAVLVDYLAVVAIALLFFLQGARLSRDAVVAGMTHWRLHALIMGCTFILCPALGLTLRALAPGLLTPPLWLGIIFLCSLPSTVQSSIAFTSIGRGNVAAAVCAATASNLAGMVITPVLVGILLSAHGGGISWNEITKIVLQLLVPFAAGQALRPWIGPWAQRNKRILSYTDRSSILIVVYSAFSAAVVEGIWRTVPLADLGSLLVVDAVLLALLLVITTWASRLLGFNKADEVTIVFCGSKKTLASGIPMANVLFAGPTVGMVVLPLMIFHQMQLMVCAAMARRYGARVDPPERALASTALRPAGGS